MEDNFATFDEYQEQFEKLMYNRHYGRAAELSKSREQRAREIIGFNRACPSCGSRVDPCIYTCGKCGFTWLRKGEDDDEMKEAKQDCETLLKKVNEFFGRPLEEVDAEITDPEERDKKIKEIEERNKLPSISIYRKTKSCVSIVAEAARKLRKIAKRFFHFYVDEKGRTRRGNGVYNSNDPGARE